MQERYTIADLERLSGIKAHTLRIWEKRYGLITPSRTNTNIRFYTDGELKKILRISYLNRNGYKISVLSKMADSEINELIEGMLRQSIDTEQLQEMFLLSITEFNETHFNEIWSSCIDQFGFEQTITSVIYPLFQRIGMLWQMNSIMPAHEHFFSNLVRNKIIVASHGLIRLKSESIEARRAILIGYPGDQHELGLLFMNYLFLSKGWETLYIGINVPEADYMGLHNIANIKCVYIHIVIGPSYKEFVETITRLMNTFKDCDILIGGNFPPIAVEQIVYPGLYFIGSPQQLLHTIH